MRLLRQDKEVPNGIVCSTGQVEAKIKEVGRSVNGIGAHFAFLESRIGL